MASNENHQKEPKQQMVERRWFQLRNIVPVKGGKNSRSGHESAYRLFLFGSEGRTVAYFGLREGFVLKNSQRYELPMPGFRMAERDNGR